MSRLAKAVLFGGIHFAAQLALYAIAFAIGPGPTSRRVLGVSLYELAEVITFPFVWLAERLEWSGIGMPALLLNSVAWGGAFYLLLAGIGALRRQA